MQKNTQGEPEALPQDADAASEPAAPVKIQPRLGFVADQAEIGVDGTSTITLEGLSGLADLNALEMTVEWDPAVVQVTGISQGEWADSPIAPSLRFDAERVEGRALLQISRKGDAIGLPEGALARIDIKGRAAGVSLFRVSAAAGLGRQGGVRPEAEAILFRVAGTN
jgi:hypothetical protein